MQIKFKDKARADEKAEHTREYVSILKRLATPSLGVRCIFEMACNLVYKVLCPLKAADTFREPLTILWLQLK